MIQETFHSQAVELLTLIQGVNRQGFIDSIDLEMICLKFGEFADTFSLMMLKGISTNDAREVVNKIEREVHLLKRNCRVR